MKEELLRITNMSVTLDGARLLKNINFMISKGESVCVTGLTASGKSLFARAIAGTVPFSSDAVFFEGRRIQKGYATLSKHFFLIHCSSQLIPSLTVADNLFALKPNRLFSGYNPQSAKKATEEVFERLGIALQPDAVAEELSKWEQHQVLLCKAFLSRAKLIILDGVCSTYSRREYEEFCRLKKAFQGISFLNISESTDPFLDSADRVAVMRGGTFSRVFFRSEVNGVALRTYTIDPEVQRSPEAIFNPKIRSDSLFCAVFSLNEKQLRFTASSGEIILIPCADVSRVIHMLMDEKYHHCFLNGKPIKNLGHGIKNGMTVIPRQLRFNGIFPNMSDEENLTMLSMRKSGRFGIINKRLTKFSAGENRAEYKKHLLPKCSPWNAFNTLLFRQAACGMRVLILEDPLSDLDIIAKEHLIQVLHFFKSVGMALVILCNDINNLGTYRTFCTRITLNDGKRKNR